MTKKNYKNLTAFSAQLFLGTALIAGSAYGASVNIPESANNNNGHEILQGANANQFIHQLNNLGANPADADVTAILNQGDVILAGDIAQITNANVNKVILQGAGGARILDINGHKGFTSSQGAIDLEISGDQSLTINNGAAVAKLTSGHVTFKGSAAHTVGADDVFTHDKDLIIIETAQLNLTGADSKVKNVRIDRADSNNGLTLNEGLTVSGEVLLTKGKITVAGGHTLTATTVNTAKDQEIALNDNAAELQVTNGTIAGTITGAGAGNGVLIKTNAAGDVDNTLALSGANTFKGGIEHEGGTIISTHANGLGDAGGAITFANNDNAKTLKITTADQADRTGVLTLEGKGKITIDTEKDIAFTGGINTANDHEKLHKTGKGTLSIDGAINYDKTIAVEEGTLNARSNTVANNLKVNLSKGATLQGSGSIGAVTSSGRVRPGTGTVGAAGAVLTVDSLETTSADSSIHITSKGNITDTLVITNGLKETASGSIDIELENNTKIAPGGLQLDDIITVGSFIDKDGNPVTINDPAALNAHLAQKKARIVNESHLLTTTKLTGTIAAVGGAKQISAKVIDQSDRLGEIFSDEKLANGFLKNYLVAGLNDKNTQNSLDEYNTDARSNLKKVVADVMYDAVTKGKEAGDRGLAQLSGASNRSAMEGTATVMNVVSGTVASHVATALGGAPVSATPAALAGQTFSRVDGQIAKLADSGLAAGQGVDGMLENGAWVRAFGGWENLSNDGSRLGNRTNVAGAAFGFDHYITPELLAGIAISYARANTKVNNGMGDSKADSYGVTLYAGSRLDDATIDASLTLAGTKYKMNRVLGTQTATAAPKSLDFGAHLGVSYVAQTASVDLTPFASIDYRNASFDSYNETGLTGPSTSAMLHFNKVRLQTLTPKVGVVLSKAMVTAGGNWTPSLTLGWKAFMPIGSNAVMTKIQGFVDSFKSDRIVKTRHMAIVGVGASMNMQNGWNLNVGYEGAYNKKLNAHEFMVKIGKRF